MKKLSIFSSLFISASMCASFVPLVSSCKNSNEYKISVTNDGNFELSQEIATKGEQCSLFIYDKNADETIIGIKSITSNGQPLKDGSWAYSIKGKKKILIVIYSQGALDDLSIELDTKEEEDVYSDFEIVTSGVTSETTRLLEGEEAVITFKCSSSSKIIDSIERINTHPGEITSDNYTFDYEEQKLTINGEAVYSSNHKISVSLNLVDKVHDISISCSDVTVESSQESVENRGKLETTLTIAKSYQQTYQIVDVVVKISDEILTRSDYTWELDNVHSYIATVKTSDKIKVDGKVQILVYVSEKTTNLFNVFITDGAEVVESPKMASQLAGLSIEIYNTIPNSDFASVDPITIISKNTSTGRETPISPDNFHYFPETHRLIIDPEGIAGEIYIRKHIRTTLDDDKAFQDVSWENLCHFANGGIDVLKEFFNYKIDNFVGLTKNLPFKCTPESTPVTFLQIPIRIIGQTHDIISGEDNVKATLTCEFDRFFTPNKEGTSWTTKFSSEGGDRKTNCWRCTDLDEDSHMREYLNSEDEAFFKGLPETIQENAQSVVKRRVTNRGDQGKKEEISDRFFLLTPAEVIGDPYKNVYPDGEGTNKNIPYEFYSSAIPTPTNDACDARKKKTPSGSSGNYWLSTMASGSTERTIYIDTNGAIKTADCNSNSYNIAPVFCIGRNEQT